MRWKRGIIERCPFNGDADAMALLVAVFEAEVGASVTQIKITEAVALLIRKAVFSRTVPQLDDSWVGGPTPLLSAHRGLVSQLIVFINGFNDWKS